MIKNQAQKRIEKLKKLINHHRYLYHVKDVQEISPAALDSLKKELFDLEQLFPSLVTSDSPTQRIGGKPLDKFPKTRHAEPMLSINDAFSEQDILDWLARNSKLLNAEEKNQLDFYGEPKLDGLAIELVYMNKVLKTGSTRGNGLIGEDVTQNLKTIDSVPLRLRASGRKEPIEIVVRGEVIITKKNFALVNNRQLKEGLAVFANPRNMAAGSIRQLDSKITALRQLEFCAYDLVSDLGQKTHQEEHLLLAALGFKTNNKYSRFCQSLKQVFEFRQSCLAKRQQLPYEIDGIVVTIDNNQISKKLGIVGKAPRAMIAFKFPLQEATTIIEDVVFQVGRTGAITPVAILKPVNLAGVMISRATLHNQDEIKKLQLKIKDTVVVGRAGDVIPDIVRVLPELRTGREKNFSFPKNCPACHSILAKSAKEAILRCLNRNCFARRKKAFYHFVSKNAFDIEGLGPKIIDRLIAENLILDAADLFFLKPGDILALPRFAEKSARNLIDAIQARKEIGLARFLFSLGIRNVGEAASRDLAEHFKSLENIKKVSQEDFEKIKDIGPIASQSIFDFFHNKENLKLLQKLNKTGVKVIDNKKQKNNQALAGIKFVLTGTLKTISRDKAKEKIRSLGGNVLESVSKNIDFVVVGIEPGSKLEKAKQLDVKIIGEPEFLQMIK